MNQQELIPRLFRSEYRKIISVLSKLFGLEHIEIAEDIVSDTFLLATETWGIKGIPENPTAWLYTVSKNRTRDYLKRHTFFHKKVKEELKYNSREKVEFEIDLSPANIDSSQLQMMFAVCHPCISTEAQIGLSLRILCGFGIEEIADAFLTNKETINKRLYRAKEKLRIKQVKIELPDKTVIDQRIETVLATLYLLFNEGYYSPSQAQTIRKELCIEAMRLTWLLQENKQTNSPNVNALLSLMCFHSSRFEARTNEKDHLVLYSEQDSSIWNQELISKGNSYLLQATTGKGLSKYHIEAAIAYWHTKQADTKEKWENILQLYNQLLQIEYSPVAALNRTYALSKAKGKKEAITEALKMEQNDNHLYHSLLGYLFEGLDNIKAHDHYTVAHNLARTQNDKATINQKIEQLRKIK
ncbi:MAG: RNA polymerase sigma factor [Chitinophagaceae bacterium]